MLLIPSVLYAVSWVKFHHSGRKLEQLRSFRLGKKDDENDYRPINLSSPPWFPRWWNVWFKFNYFPSLMITKSFPLSIRFPQETFHWNYGCLPCWLICWLYFRTHGQATVNRSCFHRLKKGLWSCWPPLPPSKASALWCKGTQSFLVRSQRVQYGKELSSSLPTDFGVPQGSLLCRLQFCNNQFLHHVVCIAFFERSTAHISFSVRFAILWVDWSINALFVYK